MDVIDCCFASGGIGGGAGVRLTACLHGGWGFGGFGRRGYTGMNVAVSDAQAVLLELARKAVSGEEIVLTRHGHAIARIVGVQRGAARLVAWGRRGAGAEPGFPLR